MPTPQQYTEAVARVWRKIGQPDVAGYVLLVEVGSQAYEDMPTEVIGLPVLSVLGVPGGAQVGLGVWDGGDTDLPARFDRHWRDEELILFG